MAGSEAARQTLEVNLNAKMKQLNEIQRQEDQTVEKKIEAKIKKVLDVAAKRTFDSKKEKDEAVRKAVELNYRAQELDDVVFEVRRSLKEAREDIRIKENQIKGLEEVLGNSQQKNKELEEGVAVRNKLIEKLESELNEIKTLVKNMGDVKNSLNRFMGSQPTSEYFLVFSKSSSSI